MDGRSPDTPAWRIVAEKVTDFTVLGREWCELEAEAEPGFFRSWAWVGCLAEERFPDPVLLRARQGGRTVGLALFNHRGGRLALGESADAVLDAPFVEHNGPLVARGVGIPPGAWLRAAWQWRGARRLVLSGVDPALAAAAGVPIRLQRREAPYVDLHALRQTGTDYLPSLSANARQQIRRSIRAYEAQGPLRLLAAADEAEALAWFRALVEWHGADWRARGKPGAFAHPFMLRFHEALIRRTWPGGGADLLRLEVGGKPVGFLYNLRAGGVVHAYQSGMDRAGIRAHEKPGLTGHVLAIQRALAAGDLAYDLMAGDQRYKTSLARHAKSLVWTTTVRPASALGATLRLGRCLAALASRSKILITRQN